MKEGEKQVGQSCCYSWGWQSGRLRPDFLFILCFPCVPPPPVPMTPLEPAGACGAQEGQDQAFCTAAGRLQPGDSPVDA